MTRIFLHGAGAPYHGASEEMSMGPTPRVARSYSLQPPEVRRLDKWARQQHASTHMALRALALSGWRPAQPLPRLARGGRWSLPLSLPGSEWVGTWVPLLRRCGLSLSEYVAAVAEQQPCVPTGARPVDRRRSSPGGVAPCGRRKQATYPVITSERAWLRALASAARVSITEWLERAGAERAPSLMPDDLPCPRRIPAGVSVTAVGGKISAGARENIRGAAGCLGTSQGGLVRALIYEGVRAAAPLTPEELFEAGAYPDDPDEVRRSLDYTIEEHRRLNAQLFAGMLGPDITAIPEDGGTP